MKALLGGLHIASPGCPRRSPPPQIPSSPSHSALELGAKTLHELCPTSERPGSPRWPPAPPPLSSPTQRAGTTTSRSTATTASRPSRTAGASAPALSPSGAIAGGSTTTPTATSRIARDTCPSTSSSTIEDAAEEVTAWFRFGFKAERQWLSFLKKAETAPPPLPPRTSVALNFGAEGKGWGFARFVKREELEQSEHLKRDSFTIRCEVVVLNEVFTEGSAKKPSPKVVAVPPSDLNQQLGGLLLTGKGADVLFEAGGETFAAHRCVLAAQSSVFSAELFGSMKEGSSTGDLVHIDDMEAQVFKVLLCFVYTDSLPEMKKEEENIMCQHLLVAADRYNMDRLKLVCEDKLCKCIDVGTVANILALAEAHHYHVLKSACFNFLSREANLTAVIASDGFEHLSASCPSVVKELFTMRSPP